MRTTLRVDALFRHPQPLHRPPFHQVYFHDFRRILRTHIPVPHRFRVNHHCRPVFALVQAAGFVDPHLISQSRLSRQLLQPSVQFALSILGARWTWCIGRTRIVTNEYVALVHRQLAGLLDRDTPRINALAACEILGYPFIRRDLVRRLMAPVKLKKISFVPPSLPPSAKMSV